ncbi:MAG: cell division protein SepF [Enterococcus sp.]
MSFLNRAATFFGLADDDSEEYEEYEDVAKTKATSVAQPKAQPVEQSHQATGTTRASSRQTHVPKPERATTQNVRTEKKIVAMPQAVKQNRRVQPVGDQAGKITILEPRVYSEAMKIAKHIISGESVLINFHLIEEEQARRIVDFLTGTVYAQDGDIKRVGDEIFLCTPRGVEIEGAAQSLADSTMFDF